MRISDGSPDVGSSELAHALRAQFQSRAIDSEKIGNFSHVLHLPTDILASAVPNPDQPVCCGVWAVPATERQPERQEFAASRQFCASRLQMPQHPPFWMPQEICTDAAGKPVDRKSVV